MEFNNITNNFNLLIHDNEFKVEYDVLKALKVEGLKKKGLYRNL